MLYLAAFSPGMGPVPWAVNAEIYPVQVHSHLRATWALTYRSYFVNTRLECRVLGYEW